MISFVMVRFISHPFSFLSISHFHISVPKFIQGYNGKPALVTKSGTFTRRDNYIEYTINVNMWAYLAKKGLFALIPTFPDFIINVGFTIEARNDEEMPGEIPWDACLFSLLPNNHDVSSSHYFPFTVHRYRGAPRRMQAHEFRSR